MRKSDKLAVRKNVKKFYRMAERIVEGLLELGYFREGDHGELTYQYTQKSKLIEGISEAMKNNLTYGNLGTMTLRNNLGQIVAKLYMLPDGTLADDSWVRNEGWKY